MINQRGAGGLGAGLGWSQDSGRGTCETGEEQAGIITAGKFKDTHECKAQDDLPQDKETGGII